MVLDGHFLSKPFADGIATPVQGGPFAFVPKSLTCTHERDSCGLPWALWGLVLAASNTRSLAPRAAVTQPRVSFLTNAEPVTSDELLKGDADDGTNCVQFEEIQPTNAVLVFADDGLAQTEGGGQFLLAESSLFADGTQQGEQDVLFSTAAA